MTERKEIAWEGDSLDVVKSFPVEIRSDLGFSLHAFEFEDLGFDKAESDALIIKAQLLEAILELVETRNYKQRDLEKLLGQPQPRISELMNGKISAMSIEKLLDYLYRLGGIANIQICIPESAKKSLRVAA